MRKVIIIAILILSIAVIVLPILNIITYFSIESGKLVVTASSNGEIKLVDVIFPHSTISLYLQSILTIVIIIVAIFGERIKSFFIRPDISYSMKKDSLPNRNDSDSELESSDYEIMIRLIAYNKGQESAINCIFTFDGVYMIGADGKVSRRESCLPEKISYSTSDTDMTIFPSCEEYLDFAKITNAHTDSSSLSNGKNDRELEILSKAGSFKYKRGTEICIPVRCKYSNSQQNKFYISINWKGDNLKEESSLSLRILTPEDFKKINPQGE